MSIAYIWAKLWNKLENVVRNTGALDIFKEHSKKGAQKFYISLALI